MDDVIETIRRLDAADDYFGINDYISNAPRDPNELVVIMSQLLLSRRYKGALLLAKILARAGMRHPPVALAQAVGGIAVGTTSDEVEGTALLRAVIDGLPADLQASLYHGFVEQVFRPLVSRAFDQGNVDTVLQYLEVARAASPILREVFDLEARAPRLEAEALRRRGHERSRLLTFDSPRRGAERKPRRAVVAVRKYFDAYSNTTRLYDHGPRICAAAEAYGWRPKAYDMTFTHLYQDYVSMAAMCRETDAEILIVDDDVTHRELARLWRNGMVDQLKKDLPDLKVVSVHFDPWVIDPNDMRETAAYSDTLWSFIPSLGVWQDPDFAHKFLAAPFPHGADYPPPEGPLPPRMVFAGAILAYNWQRAFWLAAAAKRGLPIETRRSTHQPDGLAALESYAAYMNVLRESGCALNFSMRRDLSRTTTGRCFETIVSGALLVQEETRDMDYYFLSGEHYLEFSNFADLCAIADFIRDQPEAANQVRRDGAAFAREHYRDEKIIGYLDHHLYERGPFHA